MCIDFINYKIPVLRSPFIILFLCCVFHSAFTQNYTISGYIRDDQSGEDLIGATIYCKELKKGAVTNAYGFYSLTLPAGTYNVEISFIGYEPQTIKIDPSSQTSITFKMKPASMELKAVEVFADPSRDIMESSRMGTIKIPVMQISKIPCILGENDVIKVMQLMPGVSQSGAGNASMLVRGGDADQNLILIDEAPVYNVSHLFGFMSVFNTDAIKDVEMIKGGFPASYGGRLSSVMDVHMKEGNMNEFHGTGGIGLLSSRFTFEGPIIKDKMSFTVSGRRTYIDQVLKLTGTDLPYFFYDFNAKVNYKFSDKDRLYFSSYFGRDVLRYSQDVANDTSTLALGTSAMHFGFSLGNNTNTLRWNHVFSDKLFANISFIHTRFDYDVGGDFMNNSILIRSKINDLGVKADFTYYRSPENKLKFGGSITNHNFRPNFVSTQGMISDYLKSKEGALLNSQEFAFYVLDEYDISPEWNINAGFRMSGDVSHGAFYLGPEPRLATRYRVGEKNYFKAGYSRMFQYIHRISSSSVSLPTDLWYPVTASVKPQQANQVALGYSRDVSKFKSIFEVELYYKWMSNLIEFREGTSLILNDNFEKDLLTGTGESYGMEFLLQKKDGKLTGWVSYTLSWATRHFDELNNGEVFYAKYDRRHMLNIVTQYELSRRWDLSVIWVYYSGSRFTAQIGQYVMPNAGFTSFDVVPIYTTRNAVQMSPTRRLDINFTLKPNPDKKHKFKSEWQFGIYNFFNRTSPYRVDIVPTNLGGYEYVQNGLFGSIWSVAWIFKF